MWYHNEPSRRPAHVNGWLVLVMLAAAACERPPSDEAALRDTMTADSTTARPDGAAGASDDTATRDSTDDPITIYFTRDEAPVAVTRTGPAGGSALEHALRQLMRGPTADERAAGIHSWFSDTTADALRSATIDPEGRATVDFADLRALIPNASTSAGSAMLLHELNSTVFEIAAVRSIEYRIEGSCDLFWDWLQIGCRIVERP